MRARSRQFVRREVACKTAHPDRDGPCGHVFATILGRYGPTAQVHRARPGRARGPLTLRLADAWGRGIEAATNNGGLSFSTCGCNRRGKSPVGIRKGASYYCPKWELEAEADNGFKLAQVQVVNLQHLLFCCLTSYNGAISSWCAGASGRTRR